MPPMDLPLVPPSPFSLGGGGGGGGGGVGQGPSQSSLVVVVPPPVGVVEGPPPPCETEPPPPLVVEPPWPPPVGGPQTSSKQPCASNGRVCSVVKSMESANRSAVDRTKRHAILARIVSVRTAANWDRQACPRRRPRSPCKARPRRRRSARRSRMNCSTSGWRPCRWSARWSRSRRAASAASTGN